MIVIKIVLCFFRHGHVNYIFSTDSPSVKAEWVTALNTSKLRLGEWEYFVFSQLLNLNFLRCDCIKIQVALISHQNIDLKFHVHVTN